MYDFIMGIGSTFSSYENMTWIVGTGSVTEAEVDDTFIGRQSMLNNSCDCIPFAVLLLFASAFAVSASS